MKECLIYYFLLKERAKMKIRKAIIPAAGLGTRFLPATKAQPKEMLPIVDKPTIQYIVEEAINSGIEDIIIVTGRNKRAIEDHFDRSIELEYALKDSGKDDLLDLVQDISNMVDIHYIRQKTPKGLGHAIWCARSFIGNEPFAVLLGDDVIYSKKPCLRQLMDIAEEKSCSVIGVQQIDRADVSKYGIVDGERIEDRLWKVNTLVEKPSVDKAPTDIAILGRYIISPSIFPILERTGAGSGGEIQLTDALCTLAENEEMYAYNFEGLRYDVGTKIGFLKANIEYGLRDSKLKGQLTEYLKGLKL